jgi:hypothetical protein
MGLDQDTDEIIELALLPFKYERNTGAIVRVGPDAALSAFRLMPWTFLLSGAMEKEGLTRWWRARSSMQSAHPRP